jgi:NAD(P)H-hydrate epimerase
LSKQVFWREDGVAVPSVTAEQMREVDRIAVEAFGLGILQMMENAGRNLARIVEEMLAESEAGGESGQWGEVVILAGAGGNGGGGLCAARHLHNRGFKVWLVLDREPAALRGAASHQFRILRAAGLPPVELSKVPEAIQRARVVVDAIIGYSLRGAPRGRASELIELSNRYAARVLSLDVPSGLDATTGESPGVVVHPERTLTLALPKTGLCQAPGQLYLADIGIPPEAYQRLATSFESIFDLAAFQLAQEGPGGLFHSRDWLRLKSGVGPG